MIISAWETWSNLSPFSCMPMELHVIQAMEGSRTDAVVGPVRNSDRTVGVSGIQLAGGNNFRALE